MFLLMINDSCTICIVSTTKSLTWCWLMTSDRKTRRVYGILLLLLRHSTNCTYPSMNIFTRKAIECVSLYLELTSSSNNRPFYSQIQCVTRDMKAWQIVWISKESTNETSQQNGGVGYSFSKDWNMVTVSAFLQSTGFWFVLFFKF